MLQHVFTLRGDNGAAISKKSQSTHEYRQKFNNIIKIYLVYKNRTLQFNYFIVLVLPISVLQNLFLRNQTKEIEQPIKALLLFDEISPLKIR